MPPASSASWGRSTRGRPPWTTWPRSSAAGISITAAVTRVQWKGYSINLIDMPGTSTSPPRSSAACGSWTVWWWCWTGCGASNRKPRWFGARRRRGTSRGSFSVNKMDRAEADYLAAVESVKECLDCRAVPVTMPLQHQGELVGMADLVAGEVVRWADGGKCDLELHRSAILEACAEFDEVHPGRLRRRPTSGSGRASTRRSAVECCIGTSWRSWAGPRCGTAGWPTCWTRSVATCRLLRTSAVSTPWTRTRRPSASRSRMPRCAHWCSRATSRRTLGPTWRGSTRGRFAPAKSWGSATRGGRFGWAPSGFCTPSTASRSSRWGRGTWWRSKPRSRCAPATPCSLRGIRCGWSPCPFRGRW